MKHIHAIAVAALLTCTSTISAPMVAADPARVPCGGVLDQVRESLDNDINAGIGGVRIVISSPYASGAAQQRDTNVKLAMISHGVHYMEDVNGPGIVPGAGSGAGRSTPGKRRHARRCGSPLCGVTGLRVRPRLRELRADGVQRLAAALDVDRDRLRRPEEGRHLRAGQRAAGHLRAVTG